MYVATRRDEKSEPIYGRNNVHVTPIGAKKLILGSSSIDISSLWDSFPTDSSGLDALYRPDPWAALRLPLADSFRVVGAGS
jgi:hypothetical protein